MKRLAAFTSFVLAVALAPSAFADAALGVSSLSVDGPRPLSLTLWYPGQGGEAELVGGNAVFEGTAGRRGAVPTETSVPLILVSHGGLRSASDTGAWLSAALARAGNLVVEVNGPRPATAAEAVDEIWHRPDDISRALDVILATPNWPDHIDEARVSVVGFALGGTAALALAGGVFAPESFVQSCSGGNQGPDCGWYAARNVALTSVDLVHLSMPRYDPRIQAVVAIAPEYLDVFSPLASEINVPALHVSLGPDGAPYASIGTHMAHVAVPSSTVFDGFQVCTPMGPVILEDDGGDPLLCGVSTHARRQAQATITTEIVQFLALFHD